MGRQSPRLHVTSGAVLLSWALGCSVEPPRTEPASTPGHFGAYREVVIDDAGHSPYLEKPDAFDAALHAHLQG